MIYFLICGKIILIYNLSKKEKKQVEERKTFTGTGKDGDRREGVFDALGAMHVIYHDVIKYVRETEDGGESAPEEGV